MTNDDIIKTAFKVWGQELYRTTSLTDIARELGVSKPALYRHFKDKDALLSAMNTAFFDDCAAFTKEGFERAAAAGNWLEGDLIIIRTIAEYYIRNWAAFVYALFHAYTNSDKEILSREFHKRGIDLRRLMHSEDGGEAYPAKFQLIVVTLIFSVSHFHHHNYKPGETLSEEHIKNAVDYIEDRIVKGLGLNAGKVAALNYTALEKKAAVGSEGSNGSALLRAVAEAVAEAGPWNMSMEMAARRAGLSKSGLYAHFKNKRDMLGKLFITEFLEIVNFAKAQVETTEVPEEQLYLAIISIANYLRSRPEILVSIDWIKTRELDLGKEVTARLYKAIGELKIEAIRKQDQHLLVAIAQWMLFLIVNILTWWPSKNGDEPSCTGHGKIWEKNIAEIPNECFRILFRFISLGLEGLNT